MFFLRALAGLVLFAELPVPIYWLILHPGHRFWRKRLRAAFWTATLTAWTLGGVLLFYFRAQLLAVHRPPIWMIVAGLLLIAIEPLMLRRVERDLGGMRLVGHAELTGGGELEVSGVYAHLRHPRYAAMFCAVLGACLIAATRILWIVAAVWWIVERLVIALEERELLARFGAPYAAYRRRVPAFLPFRLRPRPEEE
ncbi:MAG: isoprenylcysteine carboxylmethyltransferase family protein [Candidatus Acidiferrales bacterium]